MTSRNQAFIAAYGIDLSHLEHVAPEAPAAPAKKRPATEARVSPSEQRSHRFDGKTRAVPTPGADGRAERVSRVGAASFDATVIDVGAAWQPPASATVSATAPKAATTRQPLATSTAARQTGLPPEPRRAASVEVNMESGPAISAVAPDPTPKNIRTPSAPSAPSLPVAAGPSRGASGQPLELAAPMIDQEWESLAYGTRAHGPRKERPEHVAATVPIDTQFAAKNEHPVAVGTVAAPAPATSYGQTFAPSSAPPLHPTIELTAAGAAAGAPPVAPPSANGPSPVSVAAAPPAPLATQPVAAPATVSQAVTNPAPVAASVLATALSPPPASSSLAKSEVPDAASGHQTETARPAAATVSIAVETENRQRPTVLDALQQPAPTSATSLPAVARPFAAAWEVDTFGWPKDVERLFATHAEYFGQTGSKLVAASKEGLRVLAVTSSSSGAGATTLACCLARAAAAAGAKVGLLDADLSNPQLAPRLGLEFSRGWPVALDGAVGVEEAAISGLKEGITILPAANSQGPGTIRHARFAELLERCAATFDLLILDLGAQPLETSGAKIDAAIVVRDVRSTTEQQTVQRAAALKQSGIRAVGIAENFQNALLQRAA